LAGLMLAVFSLGKGAGAGDRRQEALWGVHSPPHTPSVFPSTIQKTTTPTESKQIRWDKVTCN